MLLNLLPLSVALRIVFKPEIITFALLPWIILCIEKYKNSNKVSYIYLATPLIATCVSSKGSIAAMLLVSIFIIYLKEIISLGLKNTFILLITLCILIIPIFNEDTKSNGLNLSQLESGASSDSNYDFKAPKSFWILLGCLLRSSWKLLVGFWALVRLVNATISIPCGRCTSKS